MKTHMHTRDNTPTCAQPRAAPLCSLPLFPASLPSPPSSSSSPAVRTRHTKRRPQEQADADAHRSPAHGNNAQEPRQHRRCAGVVAECTWFASKQLSRASVSASPASLPALTLHAHFSSPPHLMQQHFLPRYNHCTITNNHNTTPPQTVGLMGPSTTAAVTMSIPGPQLGADLFKHLVRHILR